jgi:hypothetical protein
MSALPFKKTIQYVAGGAMLAFFVVLLTLIFSFLGTIICAALAGMMLGAAKLHRWKVVAISLVFPTVIFVVLRAQGADLPERQVLMLSGLCLGTFWLIHAVVAMLIHFERKPHPSAAKGPRTRHQVPGVATGNGHFSLQALQGKWLLESSRFSAPGRRKVLEIREEHLSLRIPKTTGEVLFEATVRLNVDHILPVLTITAETDAADTLISI